MMRRVLALAFFGLAPAAHAQSLLDCNQWQEMAQMTMQKRQDGVTMMEAVKGANEATAESGAPESDRQFLLAMIRAAYGRPLAETHRGVEVAIIKFGEEVGAICWSAQAKR